MRTALFVFSVSLLGCGSSESNTPATTTDSGAADIASEVAPDTKPMGTECSSARDTAVGPIDAVSDGVVKIVSDTAGTRTVYIDATAGGFSAARDNPYTYVSLKTGARVDITDKAAFDSTGWDLAFKRATVHTNSGDAGPGLGGAAFLAGKTFDAVTVADGTSATTKIEDWFDADCQPYLDMTNAIKTSMYGWYNYDGATMQITPKTGTFIVKGAGGELYKLAIETFYGTETGGTGTVSAKFIVKYAALK